MDSEQEYNKILDFIKNYIPNLRYSVELFDKEGGIFDYYGIEMEISRALGKRIWLKSGGYIVIEETEALTAIDVNTGRYVGKRNPEDTILKTNLEAVKEITYQLRLRNIGGIIIKSDVEIGPNVIIRRSLFDNTIIEEGTYIGGKSNIGHNCKVGANCILTLDVNMGGSSEIGHECWIGMGTNIKNGVKIANNIMIGTGSVVINDIHLPGVYAGNPAWRIKDWDGKWY